LLIENPLVVAPPSYIGSVIMVSAELSGALTEGRAMVGPLVRLMHERFDAPAALHVIAELVRHDRHQTSDGLAAAAEFVAREAERRGLRLEAERGGGLLDPLVPRRLAVCEQSPSADASVRRGATVHVVVARSC
jgi:hypothetical protein